MSVGDRMKGRRVECPYAADGALVADWPVPGDFFLYAGQGWRGVTPNGVEANLVAHTVTEHEDGTITVAPSIKAGDHEHGEWHGFLERGVWREV